MDAEAKDLFQVAAWAVAAVGGVAALGKAAWELRATRKNSEQELRWRKAQTALAMLDHLYKDELSRDALMMLDWSDRPFQIEPAPADPVPVSHDELFNSLTLMELSYASKPLFIRTRLDRLFEGFDRIGHALRTELIEYEDVQYALDFYVSKRFLSHKDVVSAFLEKQGFEAALEVFARSPSWGALKTSPPHRRWYDVLDPRKWRAWNRAGRTSRATQST